METKYTQLVMRRPDLEGLPEPAVPAGYELRPFRGGEETALAAALAAAFPEDPWTVETVRARLIDAPDVVETFVVAHKGAPVATASARLAPTRFPGSGYLHWVGCAPAHRGRGLGTLVTLRTLHHFHVLGCRDSVLETDDFRLPAIRSYLNLGYAPEPRDASHEDRWKRVLEQLDSHGRS